MLYFLTRKNYYRVVRNVDGYSRILYFMAFEFCISSVYSHTRTRIHSTDFYMNRVRNKYFFFFLYLLPLIFKYINLSTLIRLKLFYIDGEELFKNFVRTRRRPFGRKSKDAFSTVTTRIPSPVLNTGGFRPFFVGHKLADIRNTIN